MSDDNVTPFRPRDGAMSHQDAAMAAQDQVIWEGDEPDGSRRVPVRVTRLEMRVKPTRHVAMPHGQRLGLLRLREVPTSFYRYMFNEVGRGHYWQLEPRQTDAELHGWLNSPDCEVHVVYVGGAPAGFFELDLKRRTEAVAISCFGLLPHARGRGLARWFLSEAIRAAWSHEPPRLRLQTNSHDSPIALRLYQQMGFNVVGTTQGYLLVGSG